jgi:hypothetical protein
VYRRHEAASSHYSTRRSGTFLQHVTSTRITCLAQDNVTNVIKQLVVKQQCVTGITCLAQDKVTSMMKQLVVKFQFKQQRDCLLAEFFKLNLMHDVNCDSLELRPHFCAQQVINAHLFLITQTLLL